jgi:hypothetical protein
VEPHTKTNGRKRERGSEKKQREVNEGSPKEAKRSAFCSGAHTQVCVCSVVGHKGRQWQVIKVGDAHKAHVSCALWLAQWFRSSGSFSNVIDWERTVTSPTFKHVYTVPFVRIAQNSELYQYGHTHTQREKKKKDLASIKIKKQKKRPRQRPQLPLRSVSPNTAATVHSTSTKLMRRENESHVERQREPVTVDAYSEDRGNGGNKQTKK